MKELHKALGIENGPSKEKVLKHLSRKSEDSVAKHAYKKEGIKLEQGGMAMRAKGGPAKKEQGGRMMKEQGGMAKESKGGRACKEQGGRTEKFLGGALANVAGQAARKFLPGMTNKAAAMMPMKTMEEAPAAVEAKCGGKARMKKAAGAVAKVRKGEY